MQKEKRTSEKTAPVRCALLSVSDKTGIVEFAKGLHTRGVTLLSTGGTAAALTQAGLPVTEAGQHTGFPEMLDGRVKTLHPKIHGGILARRDLPEHVKSLTDHGIATIDLVVVNLYPFRETVARDGCTLDDAIENIDIGGPSMVRAAAKNWKHVGIVVEPADYPSLLEALDDHGNALPEALRFDLARKAFAHTASYDGAIANWLTARNEEGVAEDFPQSFHYRGVCAQTLRYGENPHQKAAFYRDETPPAGSLSTFALLQGKALSYNNLADSDAAWECVKALPASACVIVKHANPCGVAVADNALDAYRKAWATDPVSAFGGIIAFNSVVDEAAAAVICEQFLEVLIAPAYTDGAKAILAKKPNVRVLEIALPKTSADPSILDFKRIGGGLLVQSADNRTASPDTWRVVTRKAPAADEMRDLVFAWSVAKYVKSNTIVYARHLQTVGVGAGQMSRIDSARIAALKAQQANLTLQGSVAASDAFFPFRDGLDVIVDYGATAVVQPGGSLRDEEVIAAANERDIAMVFTGMRHFRH
ncbi:MAG: bifunctional phosphoribosylaminoimidazolecarboxamide formyltransferase/IMP cyclohydrolase [Burkholderiales bacterium]|jgi:phosphoribosylaminoimidazolecarboxamide formyltransferase/IMP cyclohydrolase|nr:bifunctional phosphoribosylaminoimidazolecarboxamide formyltransferase/IMP cyclohydrolase [Burkholderiales bacterium]